jgi:hypothetical protein
MHYFVQAVRDGVARRAAARAADQRMAPKRLTVDHGFGKPTAFVVNDDGSWTLAERARARFRLGSELRRLVPSACPPRRQAKRTKRTQFGRTNPSTVVPA